ncbi:MAG TPA: hypothetical protein VMV37_01390, partial [Gammaproteobacteria bacterium]|nr:hypothetical protein [Gammaproteobacteria bacterium]
VWLPAQRVSLSEKWSDDSAELKVGIPRTRQVTIEADGLLETQLPELTLPQPAGIRQYADQPELAHDVTPEGFKSKRTVSVAVIAQKAGSLTLPKLELPWFNVKTQAWEVASLPERTFTVAPSAETSAAAPAAESAPVAVQAAQPRSAFWPIVSAVLALGWLATALAWWRSASARRGSVRGAAVARTDERHPQSERKLLRDVDAACAAGDTDAARRALLAWAEVRFTVPPRSLGALASELPGPAAHEVLSLEAHIYGAAPGRWDGRPLAAALAELDSAHRRAATTSKEEPLMPLYR